MLEFQADLAQILNTIYGHFGGIDDGNKFYDVIVSVWGFINKMRGIIKK